VLQGQWKKGYSTHESNVGAGATLRFLLRPFSDVDFSIGTIFSFLSGRCFPCWRDFFPSFPTSNFVREHREHGKGRERGEIREHREHREHKERSKSGEGIGTSSFPDKANIVMITIILPIRRINVILQL